MDPSDPTSFNHRTEVLPTGRTYHFVDQLPDGYKHGETPVLLLLHGFPDLWYGWKSQIGPWCRHGWRIIAPDMLGYGGTSKPSDPEEYTSGKISKDLASLLDVLTVDRAFVIGHDWGSIAAGKFSQWQTSRVRALIMLSAPGLAPRQALFVPASTLGKMFPNWNYMVFMASERSPAAFEKNVPNSLDLLYRSNKTLIRGLMGDDVLEKALESGDTGRSDLLSDKDLAYYSTAYTEGGFRGPTNWYRAREPSWKEETEANQSQVLPDSLPALFFQPMSDPTCPQAAVDAMKTIIPSLEIIQLEGASHWVMLERGDDVTKEVINWLDAVLEKKGKL